MYIGIIRTNPMYMARPPRQKSNSKPKTKLANTKKAIKKTGEIKTKNAKYIELKLN